MARILTDNITKGNLVAGHNRLVPRGAKLASYRTLIEGIRNGTLMQCNISSQLRQIHFLARQFLLFPKANGQFAKGKHRIVDKMNRTWVPTKNVRNLADGDIHQKGIALLVDVDGPDIYRGKVVLPPISVKVVGTKENPFIQGAGDYVHGIADGETTVPLETGRDSWQNLSPAEMKYFHRHGL
jgi:hypothetical protein